MGERARTSAVWAWILYDFSNTIFSVAILSFFFPLWIEEQVGSGGFLSGAGLVNSATAVSALLVVLTAPVLGAIADLRQRRVPYLIVLTAIAVALTAALDVAGGVVAGLALRRGRPLVPVRARVLQRAPARRLGGGPAGSADTAPRQATSAPSSA